jgi:hypothetical protein
MTYLLCQSVLFSSGSQRRATYVVDRDSLGITVFDIDDAHLEDLITALV